MTEVEDIIEKVNELKKARKKLYILTCINLIIGISFVILFVISFTEFSILGDVPVLSKLCFLIAFIINFYAVVRTVPIVKRSKKFVSDFEELHFEKLL